MKIMIIGANPSGNKGAEAMLEIVVRKLQANVPNVKFILESLTGKEDFSSFEKQNVQFELTRFTAKSILSPFSLPLSNVDVVIDIGGIAYTDKSQRDNLRSFIKHFSIIIRRKKLIFFTQDTGPANKLATKILGRFILNRAYKYFTRSQFTKETALTKYKIKSEKVLGPFPDSTLLLKDKTAPDLIENIASDYVVFSPSAILFNKYGQAYLELFDALINKAAANHTVYVLVHTFTKNATSSDADVAQKICDINHKAILVNKEDNPVVLKKFIGGAQYAISSRFHVIVGAVSSNVPAIAIGWNEKYRSVFELYGIPENSVKYDDKILETISNMIEQIENERHKVVDNLKIKNEILSSKVQNAFELLVEHL